VGRSLGWVRLALGLAGALVWAQSAIAVRGRVSRPGGAAPAERIQVELHSRLGEQTAYSAEAGADGTFELDGVPQGEYWLTVADGLGSALERRAIDVRGGSEYLDLVLPEQRIRRSGDHVISIAELGHKVPKAARRELDKAKDARTAGDLAGAIQHYEQAVRLDPECADARNDLGVAYLRSHQPERAATEMERAVRLAPGSAQFSANLGAALVAAARFGEAERAGRRALALDPARRQTQYVLGVSLAAQGREPAQALENLESAAPDYPEARVAAAEVLQGRGERAAAIEQLRKYLATGKARPEIRRLLARLQQDASAQPAPAAPTPAPDSSSSPRIR
jgi:Flp pilus assembly protein TadD